MSTPFASMAFHEISGRDIYIILGTSIWTAGIFLEIIFNLKLFHSHGQPGKKQLIGSSSEICWFGKISIAKRKFKEAAYTSNRNACHPLYFTKHTISCVIKPHIPSTLCFRIFNGYTILVIHHFEGNSIPNAAVYWIWGSIKCYWSFNENKILSRFIFHLLKYYHRKNDLLRLHHCI